MTTPDPLPTIETVDDIGRLVRAGFDDWASLGDVRVGRAGDLLHLGNGLRLRGEEVLELVSQPQRQGNANHRIEGGRTHPCLEILDRANGEPCTLGDFLLGHAERQPTAPHASAEFG